MSTKSLFGAQLFALAPAPAPVGSPKGAPWLGPASCRAFGGGIGRLDIPAAVHTWGIPCGGLPGCSEFVTGVQECADGRSELMSHDDPKQGPTDRVQRCTKATSRSHFWLHAVHVHCTRSFLGAGCPGRVDMTCFQRVPVGGLQVGLARLAVPNLGVAGSQNVVGPAHVIFINTSQGLPRCAGRMIRPAMSDDALRRPL